MTGKKESVQDPNPVDPYLINWPPGPISVILNYGTDTRIRTVRNIRILTILSNIQNFIQSSIFIKFNDRLTVPGYLKYSRMRILNSGLRNTGKREGTHQGHFLLHTLPDGLYPEAGENFTDIIRCCSDGIHISFRQHLQAKIYISYILKL
jgi:hypothetical protein